MSAGSQPREDVSFRSLGATLRGWLYRAGGDDPTPGVVMAHGFTAVKEMFLDRYAGAFAAAGLTTLVYDHPGFGTSDGTPRQSPATATQLAGYRDAIRWLGAQPGVDAEQIGIWGSSNSGGHVIVLAAEALPIRAALAQVPRLGAGEPTLSPATLAVIEDALASGDPDRVIPAVTATPDGIGVMYEDRAHEWFVRVAAERAPTWRDEVRVGAFADPGTVPLGHLAATRVPLRLVVAPADRLTPPAAAMALAPRISKLDLVKIAGGHFDAYEDQFEPTCAAALGWFAQHLH